MKRIKAGHISPFLQSSRLTGTQESGPEETILCEDCGKEIELQGVQYAERDNGIGEKVWLGLCEKCFDGADKEDVK